MLCTVDVDATFLEKNRKLDTGPHIASVSGTAPAETDGLFNHVLLLATVTSANEGDRDGNCGQLEKLVHCECDLLGDETLDGDAVVMPVEAGALAVIANVVKGNWGDKALVEHLANWGFAVEGMFAGEANEVGVTGNPFVRGTLITVIDLFSDVSLREHCVLRFGDLCHCFGELSPGNTF